MIPNPTRSPRQGRVVARHLPGRAGRSRTGTRRRSARVTGLVYIPHINLCMDFGAMEANYISGTPYVGADVKMYAGPGRQPRRLHRLGPGPASARCGRSRRTCRCGARRSPPPAASSSTERWTAGSKPSTRAPASCCGGSRPAAGSSASRSAIAGPTGASISRSSPASAAGPGAIVSGKLDPRDPTGGARLRQRGQGPADEDHGGRHALCLHACRASLLVLGVAALALSACDREERHSRSKPIGETVPAGESPDTIWPGGSAPAAARSARQALRQQCARDRRRASSCSCR